MLRDARDHKTPLARRVRLIASLTFPDPKPGCLNDEMQQTLLRAARELEKR